MQYFENLLKSGGVRLAGWGCIHRETGFAPIRITLRKGT
jgi:hypothetical protein